jgi:hypothetical protein
MNTESTNKPPYLPYTTFKNILASLNKNGIIPARIDKTVLSGQAGGTQSYLWAAFRFFGLMDEGKAPTEDLKSLVRAEGESRKEIWKEIFDRAYGPIIGDLDLTTATLGMLHEKFNDMGLAGETARKCHSFYAAAAEDAGEGLPPQLKPNTRGSSPRKARKAKAGKPENGGDDEFEELPPGTHPKPATLLLNAEGTRLVRLTAPASVTKAELQRIQSWLSFQLIVEEGE